MKFMWITIVLLLLWCVLSGRFDPLHVGLGVVSAAAVAVAVRRRSTGRTFPLLRMPRYALYLAGEIVRSNLRVARLVLGFGRISPTFVRARPGVAGDLALCVLGCSITLTPGTVTVEIDRDEMLVHVLDDQSAADLADGGMARRVAAVFAEAEESAS